MTEQQADLWPASLPEPHPAPASRHRSRSAPEQQDEIAEALGRALRQTSLAYQFAPGTYSYHAMIAVKRLARALKLKEGE